MNARLRKLRFVRARWRPFQLRLFPDLLIAGPQRTGTSWLYDNLRFHPRVLLSDPKELYFFNNLDRKDHPKFETDELDGYLDHFRLTFRDFLRRNRTMRHLYGERFWPQVRAEATASYATLAPDVIDEVMLLNPKVRVVLMLRDPVGRAWSHAKKTLGRKEGGMERVPEDEVRAYFRLGGQRQRADYEGMVANWSQRVRRGHLFLGLSEDLSKRPTELLMDLFRFLGVPADPKYVADEHRDRRQNPSEDSALPESLREDLETLFEREIQGYERLRAEILAEGPVR